ncbi:MAG TPA: hypothetical protein VEC99_17475 [Clostridia bacterium]|nr:hypothetical protein [Clostridia bacterium]
MRTTVPEKILKIADDIDAHRERAAEATGWKHRRAEQRFTF